MQLFEVVQSTPVTFPPQVAASPQLRELLLGMLEKVGARCALRGGAWGRAAVHGG